MKKPENKQESRRVNLPELENPINSNVKKEAFNGTSPCMIGVFIGYHL
jgi:hypothetical protein